jgi:hypothetical protein
MPFMAAGTLPLVIAHGHPQLIGGLLLPCVGAEEGGNQNESATRR